MNKKLKWFCILFLLLFLTGCAEPESVFVSEEEVESTAYVAVSAPPVQVGVYVCGAVKQPGIYYFDEGARVKEAVEAAGGMCEEAASASVNLADYIHDCDRIYIPTCEEAAAEIAQPASTAGKLNINLATAEELCTLPGIGTAKAESIIAYRSENGSFASIDELKNISGIKDGVFQKIKDLISV